MEDSKQLLRDINIKPNDKIIALGLGKAMKTYEKFNETLKKYDVSLIEWRYYNDGKAWLSKGEYKWKTARGTNKIKPIFWLSMWEGFFKVSFFFFFNVMDELLSLPVSKETQNLIKNANPMGKNMKFLPVVFDVFEEKQLKDLFVLLKFKKEMA